MTEPERALQKLWAGDWTTATKLWSPYLRLRYPYFLWTKDQENAEGLTGSFAMIRFMDTQVVVSLRQVILEGLETFGVMILAHEIGHHIYAPGDLTQHGLMLGRMKRMLPGAETRAAEIANLYTDLFINNRLKIRHGLPLEQIYEKISNEQQTSRLFLWYLRIYELLWDLKQKTLAKGDLLPEEEGDAILASRIIRRFAEHPVQAAGRFAALALSRLEADKAGSKENRLKWMDTLNSAQGSEIPEGLIFDDIEGEDTQHPALDTTLNDLNSEEAPSSEKKEITGGPGQKRSPDAFVHLLYDMGLKIPVEDAVMKYYRELAAPLLIPFPKRSRPPSTETLPEGLDIWDVGRPLEKIDWLESLLRGPYVIPGVTTVERLEGESPGAEKTHKPLNLDIYVDSSGSIPDPRVNFSPLCLAGAVMATSALRAGAKVRVVLWSDTGQVKSTKGFTRDLKDIFHTLTSYFGSGTAFPIQNMTNFYEAPTGADRLEKGEKNHILVISDEGINTMLVSSETPEAVDVRLRGILEKAGGGGSLVLNLYDQTWINGNIGRRFTSQGWVVYRVQSWEETVIFAKDFSKKTWGGKIE